MSKTAKLTKVFDGAQDAVGYTRALNGIVAKANEFKREFDSVYKEIGITLDVNRLRNLVLHGGWNELEQEVAAYVQEQHQAMRGHLESFYKDAFYRLKNNFTYTDFQFSAGQGPTMFLKVPDALRQPLDFVELDGEAFRAKPMDSKDFDIYVPDEVYAEFEAYVKAQNVLHDRYGDYVNTICNHLFLPQTDWLTKVIQRADISRVGNIVREMGLRF